MDVRVGPLRRLSTEELMLTLLNCGIGEVSSESLDKSERGEWKSWHKTQHSKNKNHACSNSCPLSRWCQPMDTVTDFIFLGSKITAKCHCSHEIKTLAPWKKNHDKPRQCIKRERHYFANKDTYSQSYGFSSGHVWMGQLDHKERWAPKTCCFLNAVLEKTLESPLDCKEIQPVHPKGNQPWICIERTDAEAEAPILWPPEAKNWLTGKTLMLGKIEGRRGRGQHRMRWLIISLT